MGIYGKKDKKTGKGQSGRNNLIDLFEESDKKLEELRKGILDYEKEPSRAKAKELDALHRELRKLENNRIKKNSYFQKEEGRKEFEKNEYKRFTHPGGFDGITDNTQLFNKLTDNKVEPKMNKILRDHLFSGSSFERPVKRVRGGGSASSDDKEEESKPSEGSSSTDQPKKEIEKILEDIETFQTPPQADERKDQVSLEVKKAPPDNLRGFGSKQDTSTKMIEHEKKEEKAALDQIEKDFQEAEVQYDGTPALRINRQTKQAQDRMRDFLTGLNEDDVEAAAEVYEAGKSSENKLDHTEKEAHAFNKMKQHLGPGFKDIPQEQQQLMFKYYYAETHHSKRDDVIESNQPNVPDVNNDSPNVESKTQKDTFTQEEIDSMFVDDSTEEQQQQDQQRAEAEAEFTEAQQSSAGGTAQATPPRPPNTQQDAPEFRQFNPQYTDLNIEIDDTSPSGTLDPSTQAAIPTSSTGAFTSSSILNSINFPTDEAQKLIEDRTRNKKSIEALKEEIKCMHLIYDDDIPSFKKNPHLGQKEDALKSNDINKVKAHHKSMQETIRNHYKTSDLKVGVILSAESFFGNSFAANPNLAALSQPRIPELNPSRVRAVKPGHEFDGALQGETRVNRLGRNYKKPVKRNVPKVGTGPTSQKIQEPKQVPDVEKPLFSQRGFRQRRINRNVGIPIVLKTGKR